MRPFMHHPYRIVAALGMMLSAAGCVGPPRSESPAPSDLSPRALADEMEAHLRHQVLARWYPACVDTGRGGFHQYFGFDWTPLPCDRRFGVFQARQVWTAAVVSMTLSALAEEYRGYVRHGMTFLRTRTWDSEHGGLFWTTDTEGRDIGSPVNQKHAYTQAFGVYAAVAAYEATQDREYLDFAVQVFRWLDTHGHDDRYGGYHEAFARDGSVLMQPPDPTRPASHIGVLYGGKGMNTQIHVLEALTSLIRVHDTPEVRRRLEEVFLVVRDKIAMEPGVLNQYFTADWRPLPEHDSFGHDIETGYLLLEAAEALGIPDDPGTHRMARLLVDHALDVGWDKEHGGFFDAGGFIRRPDKRDKIWWVQAEGLNVLHLMHTLYGHETDRYWKAFCAQWSFICDHQLDARHGGWHHDVAEDGTLIERDPKGLAYGWKAAYHNTRALLNCIKRLRSPGNTE